MGIDRHVDGCLMADRQRSAVRGCGDMKSIGSRDLIVLPTVVGVGGSWSDLSNI